MNSSQPLLCFIDNLTPIVWLFYVFPFLMRTRLMGDHRSKKIYYIDGSKSGVFLARLTLWLTGAELELLTFRLIDIRDDAGMLLRLRIAHQDIIDVQKDIMDNPIYKRVRKDEIVNDKMDTYLAKCIATISKEESSMFRVLFIIHVAAWKAKNEGNKNSDNVFFIHRKLWLQEIKRYGLRFGINVIPVKKAKINLKILLQSIPGGRALVKIIYFRLLGLFRRQTITGRRSVTQPCLAVEYYGHLNLNRPELHSDLFFWQQSQISGKDILIIFALIRDPLDAAKLSEITQHGMTTEVLNPKATTLASTPVYFPSLNLKPIKKLKSSSNKSEERWLRSQIIEYQYLFDYWYGLFKKDNVKIYVSWFKYGVNHCVIAGALHKLGGVTAIYQRAFQEFPSPGTTINADIVFGFSREGADLERGQNSIIPYHVAVGYFGDHRFPLLRPLARDIRNKLNQSGAKRILSYLDENSGPDSRWHTGHEFMRENYIFLLEKVLAEPWLGLIFKPKVPRTLRKRLGKVAELLERAEATGRCYVIEGGVLHGTYPPALAALASDIVIHGDLSAATAGVETTLAGAKTLLMDREGWPISKFYRTLGKGKVVFNNWQEAWDACMAYWKDPAGVPGFGDWSPMLDEIDPFRDGRAAERIGTYLKWLLDGFKAGLPRETVLADAAERYIKQWGEDKVSSIK